MKEIEDCLRQLNKVRSVAREEEVAYVARSRLGRLVLAMVRLVGRVAEVPVEDRPLRLASPQDAPPEIQTLVNLCNSLNETTKTLVQPSEPLDQRWRAGWAKLMADLDLIEQHLRVMEACMAMTERR